MATEDSQKKEEQQEIDKELVKSTLLFFRGIGVALELPQLASNHDLLSELLTNLLKVDSISKGHVSCSFSVLPSVSNFYKGLHGGAVASISERIAIACARTVVTEDKPLFLVELAMSYLSSAPINAELIVEGSVVRTGRNLTVVSIEIRPKDSKKLLYTARATFHHLPPSKL